MGYTSPTPEKEGLRNSSGPRDPLPATPAGHAQREQLSFVWVNWAGEELCGTGFCQETANAPRGWDQLPVLSHRRPSGGLQRQALTKERKPSRPLSEKMPWGAWKQPKGASRGTEARVGNGSGSRCRGAHSPSCILCLIGPWVGTLWSRMGLGSPTSSYWLLPFGDTAASAYWLLPSAMQTGISPPCGTAGLRLKTPLDTVQEHKASPDTMVSCWSMRNGPMCCSGEQSMKPHLLPNGAIVKGSLQGKHSDFLHLFLLQCIF